MQPVHVGIPRGKELIEFTSHPLLELFSDPKEVESFADVMYITTTILELCGRCLWWLPAQNGRRMILVVNPSWLVSVKGSRTKGLTFWVRPPKMAEPFPVPSSEACYFSYPSPLAPEGSDTVEP
jgi:hypothetical protein